VALGAFTGYVVAKTSAGGVLYGHGISTTNGGISGGRSLGSVGAVMYVDGSVPITGTAYNFTNGSANVSATGSRFTTELVVGQHIISSNQSSTVYLIDTITNDTNLIMHTTFTGTTTTTATAVKLDSVATSNRSDLQPNSITWASDNAPHCLVQRYNGTQAGHLLSVDGVDQAPYTVSIAGNTGTAVLTDVVWIGNAGSGGTSAPTGLIAEIALFNRSLLDSEINLLHAYSQAMWGTP
jgi:hypothetical protein